MLQLGNSQSLGDGPVSVNSNGTLDSNGFAPTITALTGSGTIVNSASGASSAAVLTLSAGGQFAGVIQDGGLGGSALTGLALTCGILTLSGTNSYSDGTTVSGGTLVASTPTALPDGGNLAVGTADNFLVHPKLDATNRTAMPAVSPAAVPEPDTLALC
jgi:autotransporter-associated beta strand protein